MRRVQFSNFNNLDTLANFVTLLNFNNLGNALGS